MRLQHPEPEVMTPHRRAEEDMMEEEEELQQEEEEEEKPVEVELPIEKKPLHTPDFPVEKEVQSKEVQGIKEAETVEAEPAFEIKRRHFSIR